MSTKKTQAEVGAAIRHLRTYTDASDTWSRREEQTFEELLAPVADALDRHVDDVLDELLQSDHAPMAIAFVSEENATVRWNNEPQSLVETYLAERGWREKSGGRRYLQALAPAELGFWEVVRVEPNRFVEVRPYGTDATPVRVRERLGSRTLLRYDALAARVLHIGNTHTFSGALLSYSPESAQRVERAMAHERDTLAEELSAPDVDGEPIVPPEELETAVAEALREHLSYALFTEWALGVLGAYHRPVTFANTGGEALMPTRTRFALNAERADVALRLADDPSLATEGDDRWVWLDEGAGDEAARTVLGTLVLAERHLTIETNSAERAREGEALLRSRLGEWLGYGLAVHDTEAAGSLAAVASGAPVAGGPSSSPDMPDVPPAELASLATTYLDTHYRRVLDEPVPMLENRTPRACAADPATRAEAVTWLKTLERTGAAMAQAPGPGPAYDFSWLWSELGLERFR